MRLSSKSIENRKSTIIYKMVDLNIIFFTEQKDIVNEAQNNTVSTVIESVITAIRKKIIKNEKIARST